MIRFVFMVNKQGQTRLARYYFGPGALPSVEERCKLETDLIRRCLCRADNQCSFLEVRQWKVVYRRYASLYFIVGLDAASNDVNELAVLELIHCLVETLDKYFANVCELDIMFNLEKAHFVLDELVMHGCIVDTNKTHALQPLQLLVKSAAQQQQQQTLSPI